MATQDPYSSVRRELKNRLARVYRQDKTQLAQAVGYALKRPGKFLRPILLMEAGLAFGAKPKKLYDAAIAVELLHNFTLVHDDIMDKPELRRGAKPVYAAWSADIAVLTGDALFALALAQLVKAEQSQNLLQAFVPSLNAICHGQALDIENSAKSALSLSKYYETIDLKTGRLFGLAARLGAIAGEASPNAEKRMESIGMLIGRAYQMADDFSEMFPDARHKSGPLERDVFMGRKTLPIVLVPKSRSKELKVLLRKRDGDLLRARLEAWGVRREAMAALTKTRLQINASISSLVRGDTRLRDYVTMVFGTSWTYDSP